MKRKRPWWFIFVLDICIAAVYIGSFYMIYYRMPRQLESEGIQIDQSEQTDYSSEEEGDRKKEGRDWMQQGTESASPRTSENQNTNLQVAEDDWSEIFADQFSAETISEESSYKSENLSIQIQKCTDGSGSNIVTYYIADIYISDIRCLQTGIAEDTFGVGYTESVVDMQKRLNAVLAVNGDYYGNSDQGIMIRNGEVYRSVADDSDVCVLYYDGTMKTFSAQEFDVEQAITDGAWQAWSFGPELLDDSGNIKTEFETSGNVSEKNPRTAIGYYEPGHYCLVVIDGRQNGYSTGMELVNMSELFYELGCQAAYNLDGGKSSVMSFQDQIVNQPVGGGRAVSDCILLKELSE